MLSSVNYPDGSPERATNDGSGQQERRSHNPWFENTAVRSQQSAISSQQSAIGSQQSAVSCQQSAVSNRQNTGRFLASVRQLSTQTLFFKSLSSLAPPQHRLSLLCIAFAERGTCCSFCTRDLLFLLHASRKQQIPSTATTSTRSPRDDRGGRRDDSAWNDSDLSGDEG